PVAASMPRQEHQAHATQATDDELVGGRAERGRDAPPLDVAQTGQLVEAAAADHAEGRFRRAGHGPPTIGKTGPVARRPGEARFRPARTPPGPPPRRRAPARAGAG